MTAAAQAERTLQQEQWFYTDRMAHACEHHGVGLDVLWSHLDTIDLTRPEPAPGLLVRSEHYRQHLPVESLVEYGNPDQFNSFGVFKRDRGTWTPILGGLIRIPERGGDGLIMQVGTDATIPEWVSAKADPAMRDEVAAWRARAYRAAKRVQSNHGWCETFDSILQKQVAMTSRTLSVTRTAGYSVGDPITNPSDVAAMPEGTILRMTSSSDEQAAFYMRVAEPHRNAAHTVRIMGWGGGAVGQYARNMTLVSVPDGTEDGYHWHTGGMELGVGGSIFSDQVWENLPVGTVFLYNLAQFIIHTDHLAETYTSRSDITRRGRYTPRDFGYDRAARVIAFPTPQNGA
jgi:hypothetical protein